MRRCIVCRTRRAMDQYMVHDSVWESSGLGRDRVAHIDCLSELIGRRITVDDLTDAPINNVARFVRGK